MQQIVFLIPENLSTWSSITAISEILEWADIYWQKSGRPAKLEQRIACSVPNFKTTFLPVMRLEEVKVPDLIIIPSLSQQYREILDKEDHLIAWLQHQHDNGSQIASICTGAFLLAATGLVNGKDCATHWDATAELAKMFPKVRASIEVVVEDERIYSNGGGYSFLNFAIFLVEKYFDRRTAILCAKMFQIDIGRRNQFPFAVFQGHKSHGDRPILKAQLYLENYICEKISIESLAQKMAMSRRNFDRRFFKVTGNRPLEYLQKLRIEMAKIALEESTRTVTEIMFDCGYADEKAFRELFKKLSGLSPMDYRIRYGLHKLQNVQD